MMHDLVYTWGLIERHGKRGDVRYTLSDEGIRYITHRDRHPGQGRRRREATHTLIREAR